MGKYESLIILQFYILIIEKNNNAGRKYIFLICGSENLIQILKLF